MSNRYESSNEFTSLVFSPPSWADSSVSTAGLPYKRSTIRIANYRSTKSSNKHIIIRELCRCATTCGLVSQFSDFLTGSWRVVVCWAAYIAGTVRPFKSKNVFREKTVWRCAVE